MLTDDQLRQRLYFRPAYYEAARIIGYNGIELAAFWAQAKKIGVQHERLLAAVYDLTRADKREEDPPRYELTQPAHKACWQLRGPAPEHPWHGRLVKGPPLDSEEEQRQWRERTGEG